MAKNATAETTETVTETKELTKAQKKALFDNYSKADSRREKARKDLEQANTDCSAAAGEIYEQMGKGPFKYNGVVIKVVKRDSKEKNEDGSPVWTTYFFRGPRQTDVEEIG